MLLAYLITDHDSLDLAMTLHVLIRYSKRFFHLAKTRVMMKCEPAAFKNGF